MNPLVKNLIEALREELKQYGEMLALLDQQQQLVLSRQGTELLESVAAVDQQAEVIRVVRLEREQRCRALGSELGVAESAGIRELVRGVPADFQPLIEALVQENNSLLVRVQQRARQNHLLLNRAIESMQRFINTLVPGTAAGGYTPQGRAHEPVQAAHALYEAVG